MIAPPAEKVSQYLILDVDGDPCHCCFDQQPSLRLGVNHSGREIATLPFSVLACLQITV